MGKRYVTYNRDGFIIRSTHVIETTPEEDKQNSWKVKVLLLLWFLFIIRFMRIDREFISEVYTNIQKLMH